MPSLGPHLRAIRASRGLAPEDVSRETNIPTGIIRDLENDDYGRFTSVTYVRSFLNSYGRFLGVDISQALPTLDTIPTKGTEEVFAVRRGLKDAQKPKPGRINSKPILLASLVSCLLVYVGWSIYSVVTTGKIPFVKTPAMAAAPKPEPSPIAAPALPEPSMKPLPIPSVGAEPSADRKAETIFLKPPPTTVAAPPSVLP